MISTISQLADGAAASLMCNQRGLEMLGVSPLARIVDWDDAALAPTQWPIAPAKGAKQMLDRSVMILKLTTTSEKMCLQEWTKG